MSWFVAEFKGLIILIFQGGVDDINGREVGPGAAAVRQTAAPPEAFGKFGEQQGGG